MDLQIRTMKLLFLLCLSTECKPRYVVAALKSLWIWFRHTKLLATQQIQYNDKDVRDLLVRGAVCDLW